MAITADLVASLVAEQFPQWRDLPVRPVARCGNDNRTFHLGDELLVRLPSAAGYAPQAEREYAWLPVLGPRLTLPIPAPLAQGRPTARYPFCFTINRYLPGEPATRDNVADLGRFARDVARFLVELQAIDPAGGPPAGAANCFRGASLAVYDGETRRFLRALADELPVGILWDRWRQALGGPWRGPDVWLHGDVAPDNLLVDQGRLCAVIDFGIMAVGDPACDYALAWTFLDAPARGVFFETVGCDQAAIARGRGWALWKAVITYHDADCERADNARYVIDQILSEVHCQTRG